MQENPLLTPYDTPFETVPFHRIEPQHFMPALQRAMEETREIITQIKNRKQPANFSNTIEALEYSSERLGHIAELFFNLNSAETNEEIQSLAREISPALAAFSNEIALDKELFAKVEAVAQSTEKETLTQEQQRLLEKTYRSFQRNGAALPEAQKEQLREYDQKLAELSTAFGEKTLAAVNSYYLAINDEAELTGLPEPVKEAAREEARERQLAEEYAFTLQITSYLPFMTYAENRRRREELARAYGSRNASGDAHDTRSEVRQIAELRYQRAQLLGYPDHASYVLEERMAQTPQKVQDFLEELQEAALPPAQREWKALSTFAAERDDITELQSWDKAYYEEKLKQARFQLNEEELKPYFPLPQVLEGAFTIAAKLYGLTFAERPDIPRYHPDVQAYAVSRMGDHLAVLYTDFFPRKGKRAGAWMTQYRGQQRKDGRNERPQISMVCNFSKPGKDRPSRLTFQEVLTLFHEFGHCLHGMLADTTYPSLSGTHVRWDFVELPSQIMENWCYQKEALALFARHYESGEPLPDAKIEALRASATFMEGMATLRQVSLAQLDLSYHLGEPAGDVLKHEQEVMAPFQLIPRVEGSNISTTFSHIFQGGYAAGYYSYKWAEVLDADAFELFQELGIFNEKVAERFRQLLSSGDTIHPSVLYRRFRGKDPDPRALLRRAGLLSPSDAPADASAGA